MRISVYALPDRVSKDQNQLFLAHFVQVLS